MRKTELLQILAEKVSLCTKCKEISETRTQTIFGDGNPNARILFLGEAGGAEEDLQGKPFVGPAGQMLTNIIKACGLQREKVYICNILKCRPPNNRLPTAEECHNCSKFLEWQIKTVNPQYIVCLGATAAQNLLKREDTISSLRGKWFNYNNSLVICTYHPSYLLRNESAKKDVWCDMQMLLSHYLVNKRLTR